jgi:hypothetical protein
LGPLNNGGARKFADGLLFNHRLSLKQSWFYEYKGTWP